MRDRQTRTGSANVGRAGDRSCPSGGIRPGKWRGGSSDWCRNWCRCWCSGDGLRVRLTDHILEPRKVRRGPRHSLGSLLSPDGVEVLDERVGTRAKAEEGLALIEGVVLVELRPLKVLIGLELAFVPGVRNIELPPLLRETVGGVLIRRANLAGGGDGPLKVGRSLRFRSTAGGASLGGPGVGSPYPSPARE